MIFINNQIRKKHCSFLEIEMVYIKSEIQRAEELLKNKYDNVNYNVSYILIRNRIKYVLFKREL